MYQLKQNFTSRYEYFASKNIVSFEISNSIAVFEHDSNKSKYFQKMFDTENI